MTVLYGHFAMDDFFITYRYAANLAAGAGFVFNAGERVFGVTEPAQVIVLALLRVVTRLSLPHLGTLVTGAGLIGLAWVLWRQSLRSGRPIAGALAGTLIAIQTFFWVCRGAGVMPGLALLAAAAALRHRPILAGLLAGSAVWFRPEIVLGVAGLGLLLLLEDRRWRSPRVLSFAAAAALVGAAGALACWLYFGRITPITLGAKQHFAAWDPALRSSGWYFWPGFEPMLARFWGPLWSVLVALGVVGAVAIARRGGLVERVLVFFGALLAVLYPLLGVPFFGWYVIPCLVAALIGYARFVSDAWAWTSARFRDAPAIRRRATLTLAALVLLAPSAQCFRSMALALANPGPSMQYEGYRAAGEWIRAHSAPEDDVAALEVGTLAFYAERRVVDLLGLVSPEAIARVRDRRVIDGLREAPTDFFVITQGLEGLIGPVRDLEWFRDGYELAQTFVGDEGQPLWVFRRRSAG